MQLEHITLSEDTQTQKDKSQMFSFIVVPVFKYLAGVTNENRKIKRDRVEVRKAGLWRGGQEGAHRWDKGENGKIGVGVA